MSIKNLQSLIEIKSTAEVGVRSQRLQHRAQACRLSQYTKHISAIYLLFEDDKESGMREVRSSFKKINK